MAQKNITFDIGGKIKEASGSYYDDATNTLVLKNVSTSNISLPSLPDGIAFVSATTISSSGGAVNGKVVTWNTSINQWGFTEPTYVDVNVANPTIPAGSDISGSFADTVNGISVRNLSNVNTGIPLPVSRGGTGLSAASIPNGESLLIGNGTSPFTFVTASNNSSRSALLSNGTGWELTNIQDVTSSVEIQIFTSSATWTRPAGTKMIRVLAQGGGGGGGSGANRNSAVAALGGSGGAAGGFIDSGIFQVSEDSIPVVVARGGKGAFLSSSGLAGLPGGEGYGSYFGNFINTQHYLAAYPGDNGLGGTLVTTTTINGGTANVYGYGENKIIDRPIYNSAAITDGGDGGGSATANVGSNIVWTSSSYYNVAGGGGGGAFNSIAYDGGNGGTSIANKGTVASPNAINAASSSVLSLIETNLSTNTQINNIFVSSGGGGGAASAITIGGIGSNGAWGSGGGGGGASTSGSTPSTAYDYQTISLRHFDLSEATPTGVFSPWGELAPDRSIYGNQFYNGTQNIISTASAGISRINSLFSDGVLSSSYIARLSSGWDGCRVDTNTTVTDNFTIESWFYLKDYGVVNDPAGGAKCYLLGDGHGFGKTNGLLLGIVNNNNNGLFVWSDNSWRGVGSTLLTPALNTWNHIAVQKQGGNIIMYLNGTGSTVIAPSTITDNCFGYSLSRSPYSDYNFNGFAKEFMVTSRVKTPAEIQQYVSDVRAGLSGSYPNPVGIKQGGDGGDGYVAVISYKY